MFQSSVLIRYRKVISLGTILAFVNNILHNSLRVFHSDVCVCVRERNSNKHFEIDIVKTKPK